jgi:F0F1-type ATP synthase membrane subunit b/b'
VDLSVAIASKLIRRNLTVEDNRALIDEMIGQLPRGQGASQVSRQ